MLVFLIPGDFFYFSVLVFPDPACAFPETDFTISGSACSQNCGGGFLAISKPGGRSLKPAAPAITAPAPIAEILMNCLRVAIYYTVLLLVVVFTKCLDIKIRGSAKILFFN